MPEGFRLTAATGPKPNGYSALMWTSACIEHAVPDW